MGAAQVPPDPGWNRFQTWGFFEWAMGAAWTAGSAVVYFLWRLSLRVVAGRAELMGELRALRQTVESGQRYLAERLDRALDRS